MPYPQKPELTFSRRKGIGQWIFSTKRDRALLACTLGIGFIFILNTSIFIFFATRNGLQENLNDLYSQTCHNVEIIDMVIHLLINIFSTIVLAASNFCAQILSAPTRGEVTEAHEKGDWLDIGAPGFRNLLGCRIAFKRKVLWVGLALSSVPLHLLFVHLACWLFICIDLLT